jgi:hypothetical protein
MAMAVRRVKGRKQRRPAREQQTSTPLLTLLQSREILNPSEKIRKLGWRLSTESLPARYSVRPPHHPPLYPSTGNRVTDRWEVSLASPPRPQ